MKYHRTLLLLLVTAGMVLLISSCGKTEVTPQTVNPEAQTETEKADSTETPMNAVPVEPEPIQQEEPETVEEEPETEAVLQQPSVMPEAPEMPEIRRLGFINPLTGEECSEEDYEKRPFAIAFSNAYGGVAKAQAALHYADVILESYTEGYTTRLLGFYQSIDGIGQMGPLRSARLHFAKLADAYGATYVHVGMDMVYCKAWLRENDVKTVDYNISYYGSDGEPYWYREDNGLSSEHTLYSHSERIRLAAEDAGISTTTEDHEEWFPFTEKSPNPSVAGGELCTVLSYQISREHATVFHYDETTGEYERWWNDIRVLDYKDGSVTAVKNVLILLTKVTQCEDNLHQTVHLEGGNGYYAANGKIVPIHWALDENGRFLITDEDGEAVSFCVGKTWICLGREECEVSWE